MELKPVSVKPVWPKSKEDIWVEKFEHLVEPIDSREVPLWTHETVLSDKQSDKQIPLRSIPLWRYVKRIPLWGYAASLLIPVLLFCHLYTVTETTKRGEQAVVQLPDHSTVMLNAESKLSYQPVRWFILEKLKLNTHLSLYASQLISRQVRLEGEAYFEVQPGNRFSVQTGDNRVNVLGTSFNVQARPNVYRVTCLSGQVEVQTGQETAVLSQLMQLTLLEQQLHIVNDVMPSSATGWMQGKFVFVETPLQEVIAEVERQYDIRVSPVSYPNHLFSGNFTKTENPNEVLEIIGKPFGISFHIE